MKILLITSFLFLISTSLICLNRYNVLYLNSGNGNYIIEKDIYAGVEETLTESDNIKLYSENLDLYSPINNSVDYTLSAFLIEKYKDIEINLLFLINSASKELYDNFLKNNISFKNIVYVDYTSNGLTDNDSIDKSISNIYYSSQIPNLLFFLKENFAVEKIYIIKESWELVPKMDAGNIDIQVVNYSDYINGKASDNDFIYLTPYALQYIDKIKTDYITSSFRNEHILAYLSSNPNIFGNRIAYLGKLKMLGIDSKLSTELYITEGISINYAISSKLTPEKNPKYSYFNLPRSKYDTDPTLVYRNIIFVISITFLLTLIIVIAILLFQKNRLLLESKQQLFKLINVLPLPIHARDRNGKYIFVNDTFLKVNHIESRKDIINLSINNTPGLSPEEISIFLKQDKEVLKLNKTIIYESDYFDAITNKQKIFKVYKSPLKYYDVESVLCVLDDVSELKDAEAQVNELNRNLEKKIQQRTIELENSLEELKITQNELLETKKMASLITLVSGISHEMNTPLGITLTQSTHIFDMTRSILENLKNNSIKKTQLESFLSNTIEAEDIVIGSLKRAINMVNRFKEIAVQKYDHPEKFNLFIFVEQQVKFYMTKLKQEGIILTLDIDKDINIINYKDALFTVLKNLIDNSINHGFNDKGGEITIKCKVESKENITLYYEDNGKGVLSTELSMLFDPFFTTSRNKGQIGLGLSIVYATITNKIKGSIDCYVPENVKGLGFKIKIKNFTK